MAMISGHYAPPASFALADVSWDRPPATLCDAALACYAALVERYSATGRADVPDIARYAAPGAGLSWEFARGLADGILALVSADVAYLAGPRPAFLDPLSPVVWAEGEYPASASDPGRYYFRTLSRADVAARGGDICALPERGATAPAWRAWLARARAALDMLHVVPCQMMARHPVYTSAQAGASFAGVIQAASDDVGAQFDAAYPALTPALEAVESGLNLTVHHGFDAVGDRYTCSCRAAGCGVFWPYGQYPAFRARVSRARWGRYSGRYLAESGYLPDDYDGPASAWHYVVGYGYAAAADHRLSEGDAGPYDGYWPDGYWPAMVAEPDGSLRQRAVAFFIEERSLYYLDFSVSGGFRYQ